MAAYQRVGWQRQHRGSMRRWRQWRRAASAWLSMSMNIRGLKQWQLMAKIGAGLNGVTRSIA